MEQEKLNFIEQQTNIRRSDFEKRMNQLIITENLDLSFYEIEQLLNIKKTSPNPLPKHSSKYIPFYGEVEKIYFILELYKYILPEYNETWLLYGKGSMFNNDTFNINPEHFDFVSRFETLKDFIIENKSLDDEIICGDNTNKVALSFQRYNFKSFFYENIITNFVNVFAGLNKLKNKLKLKDLNIAWLLSNEGNMFEKTEN